MIRMLMGRNQTESNEVKFRNGQRRKKVKEDEVKIKTLIVV